jgi:hypothetical protein
MAKTIKDLVLRLRGHQGNLIAGVLLLIMLLILLSPTFKSRRSVEVLSKSEPFVLVPKVPVANKVLVPVGKIDYFFVWVDEGVAENKLKPVDFESVELAVIAPDGRNLLKVTKPKLIKREDNAALQFSFPTISVDDAEIYSLVLEQTGNGKIKVRIPNNDQIKSGETIAIALQLAERKNWLTSMLDKIYSENIAKDDISMYLHRGLQIVQGKNPYSCAIETTEACMGYPAHLPGMYLVAAGFAKFGVDDLVRWAQVWRPIMILTWLSIGAILAIYSYRKGRPILAVAILGFWLFNRWSVNVAQIAHTDFLGVLFLLLAIILVNRMPALAALFLGISISVKQLAILIVPIFIVYLWRHKKVKFSKLFLHLVLVFIVPALITLPFFINDPSAVTKALLNVTERSAQSVHGFAPSMDQLLDVTNNSKSFLMLFIVGAVYVAGWRKEVNLVAGTLLIMAIVMGFTSVLYNQYFVWLLPFIALVVVDFSVRDKFD